MTIQEQLQTKSQTLANMVAQYRQMETAIIEMQGQVKLLQEMAAESETETETEADY